MNYKNVVHAPAGRMVPILNDKVILRRSNIGLLVYDSIPDLGRPNGRPHPTKLNYRNDRKRLAGFLG
jgi:hypothetical protein